MGVQGVYNQGMSPSYTIHGVANTPIRYPPVVVVAAWAIAFTAASSCLSTSHNAKFSKARVKSNVRSSVHCWRRAGEGGKERSREQERV